jgi:hypothetical protein
MPSGDPIDVTPSPSAPAATRGGQSGADRPDGSGDTDDRPRTIAVGSAGVVSPPGGGIGPQSGAILGPDPSAGGVDALISGVAAQVAATVKPAAAAAIATTFGFPLILMLAVILFLVAQSRMDHRDPKLRLAPLTAADNVVPFLDEGDL